MPNDAKTPSDFEVYLQPTPFINSNHEAVRSVVENLKVASYPQRERAVRLFYFVRDEIRYNPYVPMLSAEDYLASDILERGFGYCTQKALLLAALSRCAGVPCRLCFADIRNHIVPKKLSDLMGTNLFTYHGYIQLFIDGKWIKAAPAFDLALCEKHGIIPVDFDGSADAVLHPVDKQGRKHIEYVRHIGYYEDLPLDDIIKAFEKVYGQANPELMESWRGMKPGDGQDGNREK